MRSGYYVKVSIQTIPVYISQMCSGAAKAFDKKGLIFKPRICCFGETSRLKCQVG